MKKYNKKQLGFTVIELLIATVIFSMVLLVILTAFIQVGRMYYKGVSVNGTNQAARSLIDSVTSDVRFSNTFSNTQSVGSKSWFCAGQHRYTFVLKNKVAAGDTINPKSSTINAGIVQDNPGGCPPPTVDGDNPQQLLGAEMQLNQMDFICQANKTCKIKTHIVYYGADDKVFDTSDPAMKNTALEPNKASKASDARCSGNLLSTQFCATAHIDTNLTLGY